MLGLKRMCRLIEHEPGDLTTTAEAGIPLAALQGELAKRGQWLSLDPPWAERATLGGILASNASGPRRHLYGSARDLLIGLTVVMADGSVVRGGGKVVKNVAGYDLPKLFIGSFGTLGVIVEATVKLRPRPDVDRLVVARFHHLKDAGGAARAITGSDLVPAALELLDGEALRAVGAGEGGAGLLIGVDGIRRAGRLAMRRGEPAPGAPRPGRRPACWTGRRATRCGGRAARSLAKPSATSPRS